MKEEGEQPEEHPSEDFPSSADPPPSSDEKNKKQSRPRNIETSSRETDEVQEEPPFEVVTTGIVRRTNSAETPRSEKGSVREEEKMVKEWLPAGFGRSTDGLPTPPPDEKLVRQFANVVNNKMPVSSTSSKNDKKLEHTAPAGELQEEVQQLPPEETGSPGAVRVYPQGVQGHRHSEYTIDASHVPPRGRSSDFHLVDAERVKLPPLAVAESLVNSNTSPPRHRMWILGIGVVILAVALSVVTVTLTQNTLPSTTAANPPTPSPPATINDTAATITLFGREWDPESTSRMKLENTTLLSATIPSEIGQMTLLTHLDLSDISLEGSIPVEIGALTLLTYLNLKANSLDGPVPTTVGLLTGLAYFHLGVNGFTGSMPTTLGLLTQLTRLDLRQNSFHGTIPTTIGKLTKLDIFAVSKNSLDGSIPTEFGSLTELTSLLLHSNTLSGPVPTEALANLGVNLSRLWLHDNPALSGTISSLCSLISDMRIEHCDKIECNCCEDSFGNQCV